MTNSRQENESERAKARPEPKTAEDMLARGVADVVSAVLEVGASMTKVVAEAAAQGKAVPPPPSRRPVDEMVHYGVATVTEIVRLVVSGLGSAVGKVRNAARPGEGAEEAAAPEGGAGPLPAVRRGATLRVPLSIENPGTEPMRGMRAVCTSVRREGKGAGRALSTAAFKFQPEVLDVGPRDFEKLTVLVTTAANTAPGTYEAVLAIGSDAFSINLRFDVLPGKPAS